VACNKVYPFHHHTILFDQLPLNPPGLTLLLAGDDQYVISTSDAHYTTSEANEMIRMNPRSRNSRATGPNMRVPRGSLLSNISTAALSSNLI
jgi:hypothetical protein